MNRIFITFLLIVFSSNLYAVITLKEGKKIYTEIYTDENLIDKKCMFGRSVNKAYSTITQSPHLKVKDFALMNTPTEALITCGWHKKGDGAFCNGFETKDPKLHLTVYLKKYSSDPGVVCHVYEDSAACGNEISY